MKKYLWVACVVALFSGFNASAQSVDEEYRQLTVEYLQLSSVDKTYEVIVPQMLESARLMAPDVPDEWWEKLNEKITDKFKIESLSYSIAEIYIKYLSKDELKEIIAFYKTPIGSKLGSLAPSFSQDFVKWGQNIAMDIISEILKELQSDGYKVSM